MKKVIIFKVLVCVVFCCMLTGCGGSAATDELVEGGQSYGNVGEGKTAENIREEDDIQAGSSYVENEKTSRTRETFPTMQALREGVKKELGDHYWPEVPLSREELEEKTGITGNMYVEFLAEEQIMEADIDMMIIIHAKEGYVGAVEQALEDYRSRIIEDNQKYPQNLGKAEASRMETIENYICFVQLGADTTIVADKGEEEIIAYCQEENERAIDILEKAILQ